MNKKIISLILMFIMIGELMFTSMPAAKASGYLEIKATATSMTSVKITWKAQKGVTQYKIYRATENKNGNSWNFTSPTLTIQSSLTPYS